MEGEQSSGVNISDVIEVIETDEMYAGGPGTGAAPDSRNTKPYVTITEQPASKALRFRYECEGRSAGSIPGVNSTHENKTYPGIQIVGYTGPAIVVVSCVTKESPYRPHPHNLVGKEGCKRGVCTMRMQTDKITFPNLGIQCVKKKDIEEALKCREELRVDPFKTGFLHKNQPSSIDLNCVRLCFQVFLEGPRKEAFTVPLRPVVSDPIYDKKAMSDLTICKLSDCSATVAGGKEIILLCEKVAKEDINVRFYEERNDKIYWEGLADFQPTQVHKQVAICFRTPKYKHLEIVQPVTVMVQLKRPSDGAVSESVPFQLMPLDSDPVVLKRKRQKYDEEASPQNILRTPQDDSSRSTYVESPDMMYHMQQVKREPSEHSPINFNYGGSVSPMYPVTSPGSCSPHNAPSPVPPANYSNFSMLKLASGGGLLDVRSLEVPQPYKQEVPYAEPGTLRHPANISPTPYSLYQLNCEENNLNGGAPYVQGNILQHGMNPDNIGSTNIGTIYSVPVPMQANENDTHRSHFPLETVGNTAPAMNPHQFSSDLHLSDLDTDELKNLASASANLTLSDESPETPPIP